MTERRAPAERQRTCASRRGDNATRELHGLDDLNDTVIPLNVGDLTGSDGSEPEQRSPEEIAVEEESPEEAIVPRVSPDPGQPTPQQLEQHRVTHTPFRSWCKWCVMGRARGSPHQQSEDRSMPIVGLDYFYITAGGVKRRSELDFELTSAGDSALDQSRSTGETVKCLVMRCSATKAIFAHVVPCKGVERFSWLCRYSTLL